MDRSLNTLLGIHLGHRVGASQRLMKYTTPELQKDSVLSLPSPMNGDTGVITTSTLHIVV